MRALGVMSLAALAVLLAARAAAAANECEFTNNCDAKLSVCNGFCANGNAQNGAQDSYFCPSGCNKGIVDNADYNACQSYCNSACATIFNTQVCVGTLGALIYPDAVNNCKVGCTFAQQVKSCCAVQCPACQNGGTCSQSNPRTYCECPDGFIGNDCSTVIQSCPATNPCINNGTCVDLPANAGFRCSCAAGYNGTYCQTVIDNCSPNPCQNGGTCANQVNAFTCNCPLLYASDATCSQQVTACPAVNPCLNNGTCVYSSNNITCLCPRGVVGSKCESDLRACPAVTCQNGGACLEASDGIGTFQCVCANGYTGTYCDKPPAADSIGLQVGLGVAVPLIVIILLMLLIIYYYRRRYIRTGKRAPLPAWALFGYRGGNTLSNADLMMSHPEMSVARPHDPTGQTTVVSDFAIALPGYLQLDYTKDLRVDYQLSGGGGGVIYAGTLMNAAVRDNPKLKLKNEEVVIKHVPDRKDISPRDNELMFEQEISTMAALSMYPNIVTLVGYTTMPRCIIMPLYKAGDLYSVINKPNLTLHPLQLAEIALDLATAMAAIHGIGVVHRDLKTPNCLIEVESRVTPAATKLFGPRYRVYVTDFGVCRVRESSVSVNGQVFLNVFGLSYRYAPPEVFSRSMLKQQKAEVPFDEECKADVYAYAICVWELLSRQVPWATIGKDEIQQRVMAGERPPITPQMLAPTGDARGDSLRAALKGLTEACWNQEHFRRPLFSVTRGKLEELIAAFLQQLSPDEQAAFTPSSAPTPASRLPSPASTATSTIGAPPPRIRNAPTLSSSAPSASATGQSSQQPAAAARRPVPSAPPRPPKPVPPTPSQMSASTQGSLPAYAAASPNVIVVENSIHLRAKFPYVAAKSDELSFEAEEAVVLLLRNHDGWMRVRSEASGAEGWVPGNYFEELRR